MFNKGNKRRLYLLILAFGNLALAWQIFSAEKGAPKLTNLERGRPEVGQTKTNEPQSDLSFGKSTNDSLAFKPMSDYQQRQSADAVQKLQKVRELRGTGNELEAAKIYREILASDANKSIKADIKRLARLDLAEIAQRNGQFEQALQLLAEYIELFPTDTIVPEVLLRQGYILRQMGAYDLAISKFYLVGTAAARLRVDDLVYSERVTLTAQSEIADTTFTQGRFKESASFYEVLDKKGSDELNHAVIKVKLIRALSNAGNHEGVIKHGLEFLERYADSVYQAEVRYLLASSYKASGQKQESLRQWMGLLEATEVAPGELAAKWRSWKMLAGNEIGNELFVNGDYSNAILVYRGLISLDVSANWQLPIYYQIGLCFEKLLQPAKALEAYGEIVALSQKSAAKLPESLQIVVDMAKFRSEVISWRQALEPAARATETKVAEKAN